MQIRTSRPTIKEVAIAAGVSTQTVSRVINKRPDVSPETRKRVQMVIEELKYRPSALARSLIQQRSYTLGVVTAGLRFIGPSRTLSGITNAAEEKGYSLLLKELPRFDTTDITPIFQALHDRHVDGIIWAVAEVGENRQWINHQSLETSIPVVYLAMAPRQDIRVVSIDNFLGSQMAVRHLLQQGYKHIGHVAGPLDWWEAQQRMKGWEAVLAEAQVKPDVNHWAEGNWSSASGAQAIEKLFVQYPEMDAVFVGNDQMALGVMQRVAQKGLRIPEELGVVGFDDIPESAFFSPPLTTVQQDQYLIGKVAVEQIIQIIESNLEELAPERSNSFVLSPMLIVRQSSLKGRR
jgi:DNA-binding LacI/PurR family transcriptional regulator